MGRTMSIRNWTHVDDNAAAQWLVLTRGEPGEVYNVGAGNEVTNRSPTLRLLEAFGLGEEMIQHFNDSPGHELRYPVDTAKVRQLG